MLRRLWERWKTIAHAIGNFQARLLLSIFYFLILAPFALGAKLFSDPLMLRKQNFARWIPRKAEKTVTTESARRQF